jgi:phospholipase/carboxylesterase
VTAKGSLPESYAGALAALGGSTLQTLHALEAAERRLHPPALPALRSQLQPLHERLSGALRSFEDQEPPADLEGLHELLSRGARHTGRALESFLETPPPSRAALGVLRAMHERCQAQRVLYPLRTAFPPLGRYFLESALHDQLEAMDPEPPDGVRVGILEAPGQASGDGSSEPERGGFCLYVPESYDGSRDWPLVVALHGGSGHGSDFLWTWLREARSRGFLLLSPTSRGPTWSLDVPARDASAVSAMVEFVAGRFRVDRARVLATGLSDGATFALLWGLSEDAPVTALAPVSGVLHPLNFSLGNLDRARGRRIRLVHGALDWLFPVGMAHMARDALVGAGADLVYREIEDLSHTYPREENDAILSWFDPSLALPTP